MPISIPPIEALREFLGATTRHTRRVEIYEQDGLTRWEKDTVSRLKGGGVSVDYDRDERRGLDLLLSNEDGVLINAPGEFWYDKVIKAYRGVQINAPVRQPKILVISDDTVALDVQAPSFRAAMMSQDYGDVQVNTLAADYDVDLAPFDIIVSLGNQDNGALLLEAYTAGKSILVFRTSAQYFLNALTGGTSWAGSSLAIPADSEISAQPLNDPRTVGWPPFATVADTATYKAPATTVPNIFGVALHPSSTTNYAITSGENTTNGKFVAVHFPVTPYQYANDEFRLFLKAVTDWLNPVVPIAHWEVQVGEFMIDRISEPHFPYEVKITGRDYTKKCILSKFRQATAFSAGNSLESVIAAISTGAGITKKLLPATGIVIGREFFFERNTTRWEAMKEICTAYNYEIFFDPSGYLTIRPFRDPSTTAPVIYIRTGEEGMAASYEKSTSDASLFNLILVSGENSDADTPLVWAEAINDDPDSPTSIQELGERYWEFVSAFVETEEQAQDLADTYLSIHQLEEYELSWESLLLPWLEVGEIMGWIDPNPAPDDPTTFLLSSLTIPLSLGPMSGTGRRVIIAGG